MGNWFINLGKFSGIQLRLHLTWFIAFAWISVSLVYPHYAQWQYWLIGIITALLLFGSVIAHELAHSLVGRANGIPIESVTLFIFGGVAQMTKEATRPAAELKMAVAGPLCSLVLSGLFGLFYLLALNLPEPVADMIFWLAIMNGVLGVFNLLPAFPLDGGRVFRSLLWRLTSNYSRSSRIAIHLGQGLGYLLIVGGISIIFLHPFKLSWVDGVWSVFLGWFLESAASASYRQLRWQETTQDPISAQTTHLERL